MAKNIVAFLVGIIFAIGLVISQMTNPQKVLSFLNISGEWDPSLMFVMIGAIGFNIIFFRFILKRKSPILGEKFYLPSKKNIDRRLIVGSALFGIGWGILGFCPGPAIVNLVSLNYNVIIFFVAMSFGALAYQIFERISPG